MDTSGCTFVKAAPAMAESLLPSRERVAAGVRGGEFIVNVADGFRNEEDSADMELSREACCEFGSIEGTCSAPEQDQPFRSTSMYS